MGGWQHVQYCQPCAMSRQEEIPKYTIFLEESDLGQKQLWDTFWWLGLTSLMLSKMVCIQVSEAETCNM